MGLAAQARAALTAERVALAEEALGLIDWALAQMTPGRFSGGGGGFRGRR